MTEWDPYARLLTAAAASLSVDRPYSTIRRWISEGKLKPFASQGTTRFYLESDVIALDAVTLGPHPMRAFRAQGAALRREQKAEQERTRIAEAEDRRMTIVCVMPGCKKTRSKLPDLHLCNAHLAIIHDQVEADPEMLRIIGKQTMADRLKYLESFYEYATREKPPANRPTDGTIYYVQSGGHIKIGWTSDLTKRMRQYPPNCQLLATHPGTRADELKLHKMFAAHRSHGREWYPLAPAVLHHIDMMKAKHGEPDSVAFGAQPVTIPQHRDPQIIKARYSRSKR
jgi:hypothetical protein